MVQRDCGSELPAKNGHLTQYCALCCALTSSLAQKRKPLGARGERVRCALLLLRLRFILSLSLSLSLSRFDLRSRARNVKRLCVTQFVLLRDAERTDWPLRFPRFPSFSVPHVRQRERERPMQTYLLHCIYIVRTHCIHNLHGSSVYIHCEVHFGAFATYSCVMQSLRMNVRADKAHCARFFTPLSLSIRYCTCTYELLISSPLHFLRLISNWLHSLFEKKLDWNVVLQDFLIFRSWKLLNCWLIIIY